VTTSVRLAVALWLALAGSAGWARAGDRAGDFEFYVLSLSWSPSYCAAEGGAGGSAQCRSGRPYGFVVHGLWPQRERGYPADCPTATGPTRAMVGTMLDLMPDPGLVRHEWRKHGSCSGLSPAAYFDLVRRARGKVTIPKTFRKLDLYVTAAPAAVEKVFRDANPGLGADAIAVTCADRRLGEVRICLDRDLAFRACPDVDRRACRRPQVVLPPIR
jgi:ribonuclease T2